MTKGKRRITQKEREALGKIVAHLEEYRTRLEQHDAELSQSNYFRIMGELRSYIAVAGDENLYELFHRGKGSRLYAAFFRSQNDYYMRAMETQQAMELFSSESDTPMGDHIFSQVHTRDHYIQKAESFRLADLSTVRQVVSVGCGPMPETVLWVRDNTSIPDIIGIDNAHEAIHLCRRLVNQLCLNRVHFQHVDARDYNYKSADLVFVANFVAAKTGILDRIAQTGNSRTQILVEVPTGLQRLVYSDFVLHRFLTVEQEAMTDSRHCRQKTQKIVWFDPYQD